MKKEWVFTLILSLIVFFVAPTEQAYGQPPAGVVPGRYIVLLQPGVSPEAVASDHGLAPAFTYRTAIRGFAGLIPEGRIRALQSDPRVVAVIPDRLVAILEKPQGKPGGGGGNAGQVVPAGVQRIGADTVTHDGSGIGVAIVDTGLDFNHADLQPLGSASFSAVSASAQDDHGHGTHVGGIVAARDNTSDVVGVADGATLYAVKVLDRSGSGTDSQIIAGLDWIALNAESVTPSIRVANMSLGRAGTIDDNTALRAAIQALYNKNITVVAAAGNDCGMEVSEMIPAGYPEVLAIASTTAASGSNQCRFFSGFIATDTASYFTTDGKLQASIGVTISAPGDEKENISKSCFINSVGILSTKLGGGTTRMSGTSMAAPHVAGVVALMWQKTIELGLSPLGVEPARSKIRESANGVGSAPLNSPASCYSFDGEREGVVSAPGVLGTVQ